MKRLSLLTAVALTTSAKILLGGTISYVAIPPTQSDASAGIGRKYGYTTAVDGGNTRGTDRAVNEITLYSLSGAGQTSATADNCTVNALSGTLTDGGLTSKNIAADGSMREVFSDMVFNNAGGDNSQVEIVLDPESLEEGSTYDLRVYICSSSGQNRQVNLAFFGDGQNAAETGFFNEDDARTSAGRFQTAAQCYYINYRYTWDGDSTPGITITQKFGGAPFCLYALTNELVFGGQTAAAGAPAGGEAAEGEESTGAAATEGEGEAEGEEGLSAGLVDQESDQIGVESDDFYGSESLNSNGRWVKLSKWGTCWQPTNVSSGWAPYTNGSWKDCDDCGWTFVSDEPWAWACYHYGRWAKVGIGCGWAWVPGTVWAPSWVSWRQGREESCNCVGWAPLPPEAGCRIGVGISSWVDSTCDIGPDYYTFINIRDFGSDSYWGCGCIYDHGRNSTIIIDTFNITNICYNRHVNIYCGGPDYNWCNTRIRQLGGKECGKIYVNRYDNAERLGGKFAKHEGNQLGLVSPRIHGNKNPKFRPKIAESAGADKIDHGWKGIKDKKQERDLRNHIAGETKGKNPRNSPAKLPDGVAEKMKRHGSGQAAAQGGQGAGGQAGGLRPGGKRRQGQGQMQGENLQGGQAQGGAAGGADQHPGKGGRKGQEKMRGGAAAAAGAGAAGAAGQAGGYDQHPGKRGGRNQGRKAGGGQTGAAGAGQQGAGGTQQAAGGGAGRRHPGQSAKKQKGGQAAAGEGAGNAQGQGAGGAGAGDGQHPGRRRGKGANAAATGSQAAGGGGQTGGGETAGGAQGQTGGGRGGGKGKRQKSFAGAQAESAGGQGQGQAAQGTGSGGGRRGGQGKRRQQQQQQVPQQQQQGGQGQTQAGQGAASTGTGGGGGGQGRRHRQQQQTMQQSGGGGQGQAQGGGGGQGRRRQQQVQQQQAVQQSGGGGQGQAQGGGGGGQGRRRQQQMQQQQQPQQQQGGGGGGGRRRRATPTPPPG